MNSNLRYVVLLKAGEIAVESCPDELVFDVAKLVDAGICAVFDSLQQAEDFADVLRRDPKARPRSAGKWSGIGRTHFR